MGDVIKYYTMLRKGDQAYPLLKINGRERDTNKIIKLTEAFPKLEFLKSLILYNIRGKK